MSTISTQLHSEFKIRCNWRCRYLFLSNCDFLQHSHNFYTNSLWARNTVNTTMPGAISLWIQSRCNSFHSRCILNAKCGAIQLKAQIFSKNVWSNPTQTLNAIDFKASHVSIRNCEDHQRWLLNEILIPSFLTTLTLLFSIQFDQLPGGVATIAFVNNDKFQEEEKCVHILFWAHAWTTLKSEHNWTWSNLIYAIFFVQVIMYLDPSQLEG